MKRYFIKMTAAALTGMILTGCSPVPAFANSGEDPNPEEIITSFEELELIKPTDDDDEEESTPPVAEARIIDDINAELADEYEDNSLTALTPEGNMTLVDDITTKGGKQFLSMTSKSGHYYYVVIDRANSGENNVYFLNLVDERDLLSGMNEEDRTFLEEEAKKKAEEEAALEAEEKARQEAEAASAAAAAESAAAQAESEAAAAAERETRSPAGIKIGNFTLTPKMEAILACAGILMAVLVIVLVVFRKKKPTEQEVDPDDYDDYDDEFDEEPEQEEDAFDEEEE